MENNSLPILFKTEDVANLYGVKKETVQLWARENRLPSIKTRRRILFKREDVLNYLKNQNK